MVKCISRVNRQHNQWSEEVKSVTNTNDMGFFVNNEKLELEMKSGIRLCTILLIFYCTGFNVYQRMSQ